jgi:hypothetical protein
MALTIKDIIATSYPAVLKEARKAANQWKQTSVLNFLEEKGFVVRKNLGADEIQAELDYQINAGASFLATDITATSLSKTSVLGAASYAVAELSVPIVWTKRQETMNSSENQKIDYVAGLITNALDSHDQKIEDALFAATATSGFESFQTLITEDGTGTIGGIVAGTDTMWKNQFKDYGTDTGATLMADLSIVFNACEKGTGSGLRPTAIVTSPTQFGVLEGAYTPNQRWTNDKTPNGGFLTLKFRDADVVYSGAYSSDSYFFMNPKSLQLVVAKGAFRQKGQEQELEAANAYNVKLYSALQLVTNNRSRLGVCFT